MDITPFIELATLIAATAVVGIVASYFSFKQGVDSIKESTITGVNAIVNLTTLSVTASQAEAIAEVHAVPTTIPKPS